MVTSYNYRHYLLVQRNGETLADAIVLSSYYWLDKAIQGKEAALQGGFENVCILDENDCEVG